MDGGKGGTASKKKTHCLWKPVIPRWPFPLVSVGRGPLFVLIDLRTRHAALHLALDVRRGVVRARPRVEPRHQLLVQGSLLYRFSTCVGAKFYKKTLR